MAPAPEPTGRTRALLIGCNYFGTRAELHGCINDVKNIQELLTDVLQWRSDAEGMRVLVDDGSGNGYPTRNNILESLRWLVQDARPGDALFFSYSGHGAQEPDPEGFEEDGMNETILPCDFETAGMLSDDILTEYCIRQLPEGVKLTSIMDCCHSGTALDLAWKWQSGSNYWQEETNPFHLPADVQMISGCTDEQTSADGAQDLYGRASGALTSAFCHVLRGKYAQNITYAALLEEMQMHIYSNGFSQNPQLTSTQAFDACSASFSLTQASMNANTELGRVFRQRFPPQPRDMEGPLADMLGDLGMLFVADELMEAVAGDDVGTGLLGNLFGGMNEGDADKGFFGNMLNGVLDDDGDDDF